MSDLDDLLDDSVLELLEEDVAIAYRMLLDEAGFPHGGYPT